jgi:hypothetical protein
VIFKGYIYSLFQSRAIIILTFFRNDLKQFKFETARKFSPDILFFYKLDNAFIINKCPVSMKRYSLQNKRK